MGYYRTICFLSSLIGLTLFTLQVTGQTDQSKQIDISLKSISSGRADTNRVRAQLTLSNLYLNRTLDPKSALRKALVLAGQAQELSERLEFVKGVDEAVLLGGKINIRQHNIAGALARLARLSDTNRIRLLLELGKDKLRPTYTRKANRDSAIFFFRQAEALSQGVFLQKWQEEGRVLIGVAYVLSKDWPRGKAMFMQVIEARRRAGDMAGEMKLWLRMATTTFCDDCRENMNCLENALAIARRTGNRSYEALILMEMGYEYFQLDKGKTRQPERKAMDALAIQKVIGFQALNRAHHELAGQSVYTTVGEYGYLSNANYFMSDLSQAKGDLNQKLFYVLEVVKSMESSGMSDDLDYAYLKLGNAYYELGQFDKSMEYHQKSLAVSHQKGQLFIQMGLASRMVVALLKQGKPHEALRMLQNIVETDLPCSYEDKIQISQSFGACYNALKQYQQAEKYYLESITWSKEVVVQFQYGAWQRMSRFYVENGQYAKAQQYLQLLLAASKEQIIPSHQIEVHLLLFKVDSAQGNYLAAIQQYQLYKALNDSIFNEKKSNQIEHLSIQYETKKKEQDIKLKGKDIALLTEQSKSQQTQRNALVGGTLLLVALLVLGYNRYRFKQRSNKQLQAQQQVLQAQQKEINLKNEHLSELLSEKDVLLVQKDTLIGEKDQLLTEKEWLLKEIHHRVKNNLQVVMSLLNSQAASLQDQSALAAIKESQHRVQAMALIHQKLYQSESVARIPMQSYINEVVAYLHDSYDPVQPVRFNLSVEPVELDVTLAVPLGLIINEAITNAFKYAFPDGRPGSITLSLHWLQQTRYLLTIKDDGVGLPVDYDPSNSRSLGMTLMHGFSSQLGGELTITSPPGLTISLAFAEEQLIPTYTPTHYA